MRLYGDKRVGPHFNAGAGGHRVLQRRLSLDRLLRWRMAAPAHRIKGVILMDSLYGDEEKFAAWVAARRRLALPAERLHRIRRKDENADAARPARQAAHPDAKALPPDADAGHDRVRAVRLVGHAWRFCDTRLAARSAEAGAGDDSRLPRSRFVLKRAHERSPAPGTSRHLRRPRHAPLRPERDQPAAARAAGARTLAEADDAPPATVLASLLHDVGHMIHRWARIPPAAASTTCTRSWAPTGWPSASARR